MRWWVCNLLTKLLLGLAVTLRSKPRRTHDYILVSHLRPPTWRTRYLYLFPPVTWWPSYTSKHWVRPEPKSKYSLLSKSKSKLYNDQQSVGRSVLVSGAHLGPATNFSPPLFSYFWPLCCCLVVVPQQQSYCCLRSCHCPVRVYVTIVLYVSFMFCLLCHLYIRKASYKVIVSL
jgi:hypothetical protein